MESIYISGFEGKTKVLLFPKAKFKNVKISELKFQIQDRMGIEEENYRLIVVNNELESERYGQKMTFSDYGITNGATIVMVQRLLGGSPGFIPLKFADITSKDKFVPIEFASSAPEWREVGLGLSFDGVCKQFGCDAFNDIVVVNKGFYKSSGGQCALNFEITNLECPMCHVKLNKKELLGVGIYKCQLTMKCKQEKKDEISYDIVSKDKYQYAGCMSEKDKIQYEYIMLLVKEL